MAAADAADAHASSTGQTMTGAAWLDAHFELNRPGYEAQVRAIGFRPGWRVLDAACGSGSFLPWLAELVGPTGSLAALDLAPDNVAVVEDRLGGWALSTPVETRANSVLALPYADAAFDAAWFANTTQYLTDEELATALAELRRVVRPGGLVAVKDVDQTLGRVLPAPPNLLLHRIEAGARAGHVQGQGTLRAAAMPAWLRRAGLVEVWRRTTLIERAAPLAPAARQQWRNFLAFCAGHVADLDVPAADHAYWAVLRDPAGLDRLLDDPDFYGCEGNTLAVGRVPTAG